MKGKVSLCGIKIVITVMWVFLAKLLHLECLHAILAKLLHLECLCTIFSKTATYSKCNKTFKHKKSLSCHKNIHHGTKGFSCEKCNILKEKMHWKNTVVVVRVQKSDFAKFVANSVNISYYIYFLLLFKAGQIIR